MNKKQIQEIQEKINNYKSKYIYQRINGIINKYEVVDNYYIDTKTGLSININNQLLLGRLSENILDLIELADILKIYIRDDKKHAIYLTIDSQKQLEIIKEELDINMIKEILTHEQFENNCFKI